MIEFQQFNRDTEASVLIPNFLSILKSRQPDAMISSELVELLGYDYVDLVPDLVANKDDFLQEASFSICRHE